MSEPAAIADILRALSRQTSANPDAVHRFIYLSDIASSSRLAEAFPQEYRRALDAHNAHIETLVPAHGGSIYKNTGDGYFVFFNSAEALLDCARELALAFERIEPLSPEDPFLVRIALHAGELRPAGAEFFGPALNRVSRICQVCSGGQLLCSSAVVSGLREEQRRQFADLGLHYLRDLSEPEHLYQVDDGRFARHEFPPLATLGNRPNNLLFQPNAFVGREREISEISSLLLGETRLLNIVAPGGYGKSRLSVQICANLLPHFAHGVFFIELAPISEPERIVNQIASAISFQFFGSRDPQDQLMDYLRGKELLLGFDNFEHLIEAAPLLPKLLSNAEKLRIISNAREPLRVAGEQVYQLEPLPVQGENSEVSDAVQLFADRVARVSPGFRLDAQTRPLAEKLCQRLEGIPLPIELAAAWADQFTLEELLAELSQQLELTARLKDVPERHRSVRASLDWSWQLISDEQRRMLLRLAVFHGGFFIDGAAAVLGLSGMRLREALAGLSDKSWLYQRPQEGQTRYFVRDLVSHEYAFGKLIESGQFDDAALTHARYFSGLLLEEGPHLEGTGRANAQASALKRIQLELDNIDTAAHNLAGQLNRVEAAQLLFPIVRWQQVFLEMSSDFNGISRRLEALEAVMPAVDSPTALRFWLLHGRGLALLRLSKLEDAEQFFNAAMELAESAGDAANAAQALRQLAIVQFRRGEFDAARALLHRALPPLQGAGEMAAQASLLTSLGIIEDLQGEREQARAHLANALQLERENCDYIGQAYVLNALALLEAKADNMERAKELFENNLAISRQLGHRSGIAVALGNLGDLANRSRDYETARELLTQSLELHGEIGDPASIASVRNNLGLTEQYHGNQAQAQEHLQVALELRSAIGDRHGMAVTLNNLASVRFAEKDLPGASALVEQALQQYRAIGNRGGAASALGNIALLKQAQGLHAEAISLLEESLTLRREIADKRGIAICLCSLAASECALDLIEPAREHLQACLVLRRAANDPVGLCVALMVAADLLLHLGNLRVAALCLYGVRQLVPAYGQGLQSEVEKMSVGPLAALEAEGGGLPVEERERLQSESAALGLAELADIALEALAVQTEQIAGS